MNRLNFLSLQPWIGRISQPDLRVGEITLDLSEFKRGLYLICATGIKSKVAEFALEAAESICVIELIESATFYL